MYEWLLIALLFFQIISWISIKKQISTSASEKNDLEEIHKRNEIISKELDDKSEVIASLMHEIETINCSLSQTEEELARVIARTYTLSEKLATTRDELDQQSKVMPIEYEKKLKQFSSALEYKKNEITHLNEIINALQNSNKIETKRELVKDVKDIQFGISDETESYSGERDGFKFQDESLTIYEGGTFGDNEYSEMNFDGDDY